VFETPISFANSILYVYHDSSISVLPDVTQIIEHYVCLAMRAMGQIDHQCSIAHQGKHSVLVSPHFGRTIYSLIPLPARKRPLESRKAAPHTNIQVAIFFKSDSQSQAVLIYIVPQATLARNARIPEKDEKECHALFHICMYCSRTKTERLIQIPG
jgi:hypothetical protein